MNAQQAYDQLVAHGRTSTDLASALNLLSWDQQVLLPPAAHAGRAEQIGALTAILHAGTGDGPTLEIAWKKDGRTLGKPVCAKNVRQASQD